MKPELIGVDQITPDDRANNRIVQMSDGSYRKLTPTGDVLTENTGIVIAYDIGHAVDLIRKGNVKGPEIK